MIIIKYDMSDMLETMTKEEITEKGMEVASQVKNAFPDENVIFMPDFITISKATTKYLTQYRDMLNTLIEQESAKEEQEKLDKYFD